MEIKSEKQTNVCDYCGKIILGGKYNFEAHLYQHNVVKPRYSCQICCKQYYRKDCFNRHMDNHAGKHKRKFVCDYCDRGFIDKRNLENHLKIHEDNNLRNTIKKYTCMACGIGYVEERLLKYHIRKQHFNLHHKENEYEKKKLNETWIEPVLETNVYVQMTKVNDNVLSIKKCDTIKTEVTDRVKIEDMKGLKKLKINNVSGFEEYLNSVFACADNTQYSKAICNYCHKEMLKKSLQPHIRERHLKIRKFACVVCNRSFKRHYQLVDHVCGKPIRRRRS